MIDLLILLTFWFVICAVLFGFGLWRYVQDLDEQERRDDDERL